MLFTEEGVPRLVEQRPLDRQLWSASSNESVEPCLDIAAHDEPTRGLGGAQLAAHVDPDRGDVGRRQRAARLHRCVTRPLEPSFENCERP